MVVNEDCKSETLSVIQTGIEMASVFLQGDTRNQARQMIIQFANNLRYDLELTLAEYLNAHPEIKTDNPILIQLVPQCAY